MSIVEAILINNVKVCELLFYSPLTKGVLSKDVIEELRETYRAFEKVKPDGNYNNFTSRGSIYPDGLPRLQYLLKNIYKCREQTVENFFEQYGGLLKVLTLFKTDVIMDDLNWQPLPITNFVYKLVSPYPCVINLAKDETNRCCRRYSDIICLWSFGKTTRQTSDGYTFRFEQTDNFIERCISNVLCKIILFEHRRK